MKFYITKRTELKKALLKAFEDDNWDVDNIDIDNIVWNVIKDKKPVELISSGKITMPYDDILMYPDIKPDDLAKYIGSEVNFYIEVKESKDV